LVKNGIDGIKINTLSEQELVRGCQQSKPHAQELVYSRYADYLFRVGYRYLRDVAETEDALIITFTKAFKHISDFHYKGDGSLKGWIKKILINEALMRLRKKYSFNLLERVDDHEVETSLEILTELEAEDIYKTIDQLPEGYRTVFHLHVVEGYSHEEIGQMLSITDSTSRSQLFKAKAHLKKILTREGFHYGT
jgi:RNA polymerase sigma-70 factor (ECF subfamily)